MKASEGRRAKLGEKMAPSCQFRNRYVGQRFTWKKQVTSRQTGSNMFHTGVLLAETTYSIDHVDEHLILTFPFKF